eukprot:INCI14234.1.p1 GENE.INCI14234.1~~INCI14234.1.p1  ORF type:complete len:518 (-),score=53.43 INCI14234.1:376-1929(-)
MYGSTASRSQGGGELLDVVSSGGSQQRYEPSAGASRQDTNSRVPPPASRATPLLRRQPRDLRRLYYQRINVISAAIEPSWSHPRKMTVDDSFFSVDPNIRPLSPSKDVAALHRDAAHALDDPVAGCDVTPGGTQIARDGDDDDDDDELKVTRISLVKSIFNLTNTTVGAGTLALPYYVAQTGFGLGLGLLALVACLSDFALGLLMECGKITQTSSYFDVAREAYGRAGGLVIQITIFLLCFGALTAYLVIVGTLSEMGLQQITVMSPNIELNLTAWYLSTNTLGGAFTLFLILPLGLLKNMSALSFASLLSLFAIVFVILAVAYMNFSYIAEAVGQGTFSMDSDWAGHLSVTIFQVFPTAGLAFTNHTNIYEIVRELKEPTEKRQKQLIHITTIATFTIYVFISVPSYMRFANATCDDILLNFKMNGTASSSDCEYTIPNQSFLDQVLVLVGIFSMTISLVLSAPIILFPARMCLHELLRGCISLIPGASKLSGTFYRVAETVLILGVVSVAKPLLP